MLPIWIIDLGGSAVSQDKLQSLLGRTGDSLRQYWHYCHVKAEPVHDWESCRALMDFLVAEGRECFSCEH